MLFGSPCHMQYFIFQIFLLWFRTGLYLCLSRSIALIKHTTKRNQSVFNTQRNIISTYSIPLFSVFDFFFHSFFLSFFSIVKFSFYFFLFQSFVFCLACYCSHRLSFLPIIDCVLSHNAHTNPHTQLVTSDIVIIFVRIKKNTFWTSLSHFDDIILCIIVNNSSYCLPYSFRRQSFFCVYSVTSIIFAYA